jgi:uncharacterized protein (TIGR02996 family)
MNPLLPEKYRHEHAFIREILYDPADYAPRLVYADWLDERQDVRAQWLRLEVELQQVTNKDPRQASMLAKRTQLQHQIDRVWINLLALAKIEKCSSNRNDSDAQRDEPEESPPEPAENGHVFFQYRCPKRWENLLPMQEDQATRFCNECQRTVHYCHDIETARRQARRGNCIAVDASVPRKPYDLDFDSDLDSLYSLGTPLHDF